MIAARTRDVRVMHSASSANCGADPGRPLICLIPSRSHSIVMRLPSLFLLQPEVLRLHVFACSTSAAEGQSSCGCIRPGSYRNFVSQLPHRIAQPNGLACTAKPCCGILTRRCSTTPLSVLTTRSQVYVVRSSEALQMLSVRFSCIQLRQCLFLVL